MGLGLGPTSSHQPQLHQAENPLQSVQSKHSCSSPDPGHRAVLLRQAGPGPFPSRSWSWQMGFLVMSSLLGWEGTSRRQSHSRTPGPQGSQDGGSTPREENNQDSRLLLQLPEKVSPRKEGRSSYPQGTNARDYIFVYVMWQ